MEAEAKTSYKERVDFEQRVEDSKRLRAKHMSRIPVIVEPAPSCTLKTIDRTNFLVPSDITLGQFIFVIRKRLQLKSEIAMYVYVNNKLMTTSDLLSVIDAKERDADGFLYLTYNGEWFFG